MSAVRLVRTAALGVAVWLTFATAAQTVGDFTPSRLWDGTTPDFRGLWRAEGTGYLNVEGHRGGRGVAAAQSLVVDPPDGKIPYKPEALAQRRANYRAREKNDPSVYCYQAGVPRATYLPTPMQILQSPGNFAIVYQENHALRVFYPDARPHFEAADFWMGDTRYRFEGDTLVADVVALTDQLWLDHAGNFHSTEFHVVERYRMTSADTIEYEARIEDPVVYKRPWTLRTVLHRLEEPGARIVEDECLDDENGVRRHVSPYDPKSLLKADYSRWKNAQN
jgi:hypothetical protein